MVFGQFGEIGEKKAWFVAFTGQRVEPGNGVDAGDSVWLKISFRRAPVESCSRRLLHLSEAYAGYKLRNFPCCRYRPQESRIIWTWINCSQSYVLLFYQFRLYNRTNFELTG